MKKWQKAIRLVYWKTTYQKTNLSISKPELSIYQIYQKKISMQGLNQIPSHNITIDQCILEKSNQKFKSY